MGQTRIKSNPLAIVARGDLATTNSLRLVVACMDQWNEEQLMEYKPVIKGSIDLLSVNERLKRYFVEGHPQHVIQRGNNRDVIFVEDADYLFYLECLAESALKNQLHIHAYVLMTNHVHLLATPGNADSLPKAMQSIGRRYVQFFNRNYGRTGTLWEGRYKATVIDTDNYFLACSRYIELNPVRAGMVSQPENYPWSSYTRNALGDPVGFVTPHETYVALGHDAATRQRAYIGLFDTDLTEQQVKEIRESTNKGWALGGDRFKERIGELSQRRAGRLSSGRPKRSS